MPLAYSGYIHSPTVDEPAHLVAGLTHWKFHRFDLYSVNPPLVRLIAALPVVAAGYREDWSAFESGLGARPEFALGHDFVKANGERSLFLFMIARWACIPFSWLGALFCFLWARDLYGRPAAVLACAIWSFEPNILAHAALIAPDVHAAAIGVAACYLYWRWLKRPTWWRTALAGLAIGAAELAKSTFILLLPLLPALWLIIRLTQRRSKSIRDLANEAGMVSVWLLIGVYVLNMGYAFEGSCRPLRDFQFVSRLLATAGPSSNGEAKETPHSPHNSFASSWLGRLPVPLPRQYLLGIDLQQGDFEDYGRPSYLRGQWQDRGWWYYYLYALAIKSQLGLWGLAIVRAGTRFSWTKSCRLEGRIVLARDPSRNIRDRQLENGL